ncbi:MAG: hypothetical protein RIB84_27425 [Sneathiellaceae bacterium]
MAETGGPSARRDGVWPGLAAGGWRDLAFEPFRDKVEIHWLERGEGAALRRPAALCARRTGAAAQPCRHGIYRRAGRRTERCGRDPGKGAVVIIRPGTSHEVWSDTGCVVLIQWDRPVQVVGES